MPVAYSYDLRKKVMEALDEGESGETVILDNATFHKSNKIC